MATYRVSRREQAWYGESIGILILDASYPCVPGNVGNASTFSFPVRYEKVMGASIDRLLNQQDPGLVEPFVDAARNLQSAGVKAITGACGFMALFQQQVAASVDIPVFLSSLLQVPFIYRITGKNVGIITALASRLTPKHFAAVGIPENLPVAIGVARNLVRENPDMGAILLECSDLPPYADAVQQAAGLPVFDFITMINYVHAGLVRTPYRGFM